MFKAWICVIILSASYDGSMETVTLADLADRNSCERAGSRVVRDAKTNHGQHASYTCTEINHTPE